MKFENGFYKLEVIQYYDVDQDELLGIGERDILFNFIETSAIKPSVRTFLVYILSCLDKRGITKVCQIISFPFYLVVLKWHHIVFRFPENDLQFLQFR